MGREPALCPHGDPSSPAGDLDVATARKLVELTLSFYDHVGSSFSATRQSPWPGWDRAWRTAQQIMAPLAEEAPLRLLDMGCGNLRFERFVAQQLSRSFEAWGVDSCPALAEEGAPDDCHLHLRELDIAGALLGDMSAAALADACEAPQADLAVAFGLFHHVPTADARKRLMEALVHAVRPGGVVIASLWRFADDERLAAKAQAVTARARKAHGLPSLPPDDFLMGWQDDLGAFRYCHHFPEAEVNTLARTVEPMAREADRFSADGRSGTLNRYLVLQRHEATC